jgi:hypothetical protein
MAYHEEREPQNRELFRQFVELIESQQIIDMRIGLHPMLRELGVDEVSPGEPLSLYVRHTLTGKTHVTMSATLLKRPTER